MTINCTGEKSAIPGVCQNYHQKGADGECTPRHDPEGHNITYYYSDFGYTTLMRNHQNQNEEHSCFLKQREYVFFKGINLIKGKG